LFSKKIKAKRLGRKTIEKQNTQNLTPKKNTYTKKKKAKGLNKAKARRC
jgi:hypothetical protein